MKQSGNSTTPTLQPFMQICICSLKQGINTILEKTYHEVSQAWSKNGEKQGELIIFFQV